MVIPVPEAESDIAYYDSLYPGDFKMPKQLIHIQRESPFTQTTLCRFLQPVALYCPCSFLTLALLVAFSLDTEQPDYDLDSEDDTFVNKLKKKMDVGALQFEEMIDRLEKGSGQQVLDTGLRLVICMLGKK